MSDKFMSDKLCSDKEIIVVTGASRGIGRAAVRAFSKKGLLVYAAARSRENLESLSAETGCLYSVGDVGDEGFVKELFQKVSEAGTLRSVVNNAGISLVGLVQDLSLDDWNRIVRTNVTSAFLTSRAAIPLLLKAGTGSIVNVSSVWGVHGASCEAAYSATKGAINAFTKALARELAPSNICVNAAAFGTIDTSMNSFLTPEDRAALNEEIGMGRFGTPEEAADLLVDLALHHPYMTGQILVMDGAWT